MKRLFGLLLALILLCGCAPASGPAQTAAPTMETAAQETPPTEETGPDAEPVALSGLPDLTADTVLLYRQADFDGRQGTLVPLKEVLSAPAEELLPRSHHYDELFPGDAALWLKLLDYALGNGYQGFSVPAGTLPELGTDQRSAFGFLYRVDDGKVLSLEKDGVTTTWMSCTRPDTMEKFSMGLAEARRLAAEAPRGDDWQTALWIMDTLADRITYGDRDTYYFKRGHMLFDALVDGDTVCSGYSAGMYYLCSLCGLECLEVTGLARSVEKAGGLDDHVWDFVEICGSWYCFDPTWYDGETRAPAPFFCGLSEEVLDYLGGHRRTGEYTDKTMLPSCDACFDPVEIWNGSPEGALRSWLLYASFAASEPSYLLMYAGLMTPETGFTVSADNREAVVDTPYADYAAWAERFMGGDVLGPVQFAETEDGKLLLRRWEADNGIDSSMLEIRSVTLAADGSYTADLGGVTAVFTVSQTAEGLYRIETVELR